MKSFQKLITLITLLTLLFIQVTPAYAAAPVITMAAGPETITATTWNRVDSAATIVDSDGLGAPGWDGAVLTALATIGGGGDTNSISRLRIANLNCTVPGSINRNGTEIRSFISGACTIIGTLNGHQTDTLTVTFNNNATLPLIQATLQQLDFNENSAISNAEPRYVDVNLTEADTVTVSNTARKTFNIDALPHIQFWNSPDPTYTQYNPPLQLDTDAVITDPDTADLTGTTITLSIIDDPFGSIPTQCFPSEDMLGIGNYGLITTSGNNVIYNGTIFGTFAGGPDYCASPLVITLNSNADNTSMSALANALTYQNIAPSPTDTFVRQMRLQTTQNGGSHVEQGKRVTIAVVNIPPVLTSFTRYNPATSPTNADTLVFRATFSEGVQNVDTTDFTVNSTSTATVTNVNPVYAPGAWTFCANENATCSFTGTKLVRYGAPGFYNYGIYTSSVACTNAVFGDPIVGTAKTCDYADLPSVFDITVSGGDLITYNGTVGLDLAGGQNIQNILGTALPAGEPTTDELYTLDNTPPPALTSFTRYNPATSPTSADVLVFRAIFSDYVQNVDITDFLKNSTSTAGVTNVTRVGTFCANEGGVCSFTGTRFVRYGSGGTYSAITGPFSNSVA